jgi:hypothetical protein
MFGYISSVRFIMVWRSRSLLTEVHVSTSDMHDFSEGNLVGRPTFSQAQSQAQNSALIHFLKVTTCLELPFPHFLTIK